MNRYSKARREALKALDMPLDSTMAYTDIAKRLAFKTNAILEGLDLSQRNHAKAFVEAWSYRNERYVAKQN